MLPVSIFLTGYIHAYTMATQSAFFIFTDLDPYSHLKQPSLPYIIIFSILSFHIQFHVRTNDESLNSTDMTQSPSYAPLGA